MTPPGPNDRDKLVPKHPRPRSDPGSRVPEEIEKEDTDVGGDQPTRIEKRVVNADRSSRAAFAMIKELRDDLKQHSIMDKEALDEIRADNKQQTALMTEMRITQASTVVELRALSSHIRQDQEHSKLRLIASAEVQKVTQTGEVETKKFQREHASRRTIQILAIVGAAIVATITALLTAYLKS